MSDDDVIPTLLAYRHRDRFKAWCSWCDSWHHWHSVGEVDGKCPVFTPNSSRVRLIDAGAYKPAMRTKYSERRI